MSLRDLPKTLREAVIQDRAFCERYEIGITTTITINGRLLIEQSSLVSAARAALHQKISQPISSAEGVEGRIVLLSDQQERIGIEIGEDHFQLDDYLVLSPNSATRIAAFKTIADRDGLLGEKRQRWADQIVKEELADEDMIALLGDLAEAPLAVQRIISSTVARGSAPLTVLTPNSSEYWLALVGGKTQGRAIDEFIKDSFRTVINRWMDIGPEAALLTALPWAVSPYSPFEELHSMGIGPELMQASISDLQEVPDPFSKVGLIDFMTRLAVADTDWVEQGVSILQRVLEDDLSLRCRFLSSFYLITYAHVAARNEFQDEPPWWRRLVSFLHASELVRLFWMEVDVDDMEDAAHQGSLEAYLAATSVDLRKEAAWRGQWASALHLEAEVLGRLSNVIGSSEILINIMQADHESRDQRVPRFICMYPGPVERIERNRDAPWPNTLPALSEFIAAADSPLGKQGLELIANLAPIVALPEEILKRLFVNVQRSTFPTALDEQSRFVNICGELAHISAEAKDRELASALIEKIGSAALHPLPARLRLPLVTAGIVCTASASTDEEWGKMVRELCYALAQAEAPVRHTAAEFLRSIRLFTPPSTDLRYAIARLAI
jgi:hypothetical protein